MISRRRFVAVCAALAWPAHAQEQKTTRIGFLGPTTPSAIASRLDAFRSGMAEHGYVEGRNLVIEFRWAEGNYDRLPELAAELVHLKVDLIVTHSAPGARAAKQATTTIPIVFAPVGDPVLAGLMTNLARPGGNITGMSFFTPELNAKRLELLRETVPRIRRVAILFNSNNFSTPLPAIRVAAASLKVELQEFGVRNPGEFENAFATMRKRQIEAVAINDDAVLMASVGTITSLAAKYRIPSVGNSELADAGGLLAYGVSVPAIARRAAAYVDKILKGAKPGDLPIEQATKFEVVVNMKTAKALGIKIPGSILVRADRVIE